MAESGEKGLESLQIWQKAINFTARVYKEILPKIPLEEKWAMASQLRRATQSVAANIAEGHGRFYYQDNIRFCYFARGSLEETQTFLTLAYRVNYIDEKDFISLSEDISELRRMVGGYIAYLKASKRGQSEPGAQLSIKEKADEYEFGVDDALTDN